MPRPIGQAAAPGARSQVRGPRFVCEKTPKIASRNHDFWDMRKLLREESNIEVQYPRGPL